MTWTDDLELRGLDGMDPFPGDFNSELKSWNLFQFRFEFSERQAQIDHGGDKHIAADAADEVSVRYSHNVFVRGLIMVGNSWRGYEDEKKSIL